MRANPLSPCDCVIWMRLLYMDSAALWGSGWFVWVRLRCGDAVGLSGCDCVMWNQVCYVEPSASWRIECVTGAAKTSFMTKCERTTCESQAADKKLNGAASGSLRQEVHRRRPESRDDVTAIRAAPRPRTGRGRPAAIRRGGQPPSRVRIVCRRAGWTGPRRRARSAQALSRSCVVSMAAPLTSTTTSPFCTPNWRRSSSRRRRRRRPRRRALERQLLRDRGREVHRPRRLGTASGS